MLETQMVQAQQERSVRQAIRRGLACRCPACGEAPMFASYLKVSPSCSSCGEELHHHRADDGPAYLTMTIVCQFVGIMLPLLFIWTDLSPTMVCAVVMLTVVPMTLYLLPRTKGFWVAIQWAKRMHGFGLSTAARA